MTAPTCTSINKWSLPTKTLWLIAARLDSLYYAPMCLLIKGLCFMMIKYLIRATAQADKTFSSLPSWQTTILKSRSRRKITRRIHWLTIIQNPYRAFLTYNILKAPLRNMFRAEKWTRWIKVIILIKSINKIFKFLMKVGMTH